MTTRSDPPAHLDLWSLVAIYAAAATIVVEANYQLPMALLAEWGRILRDA
ncbi:hypothetical protein MKK84_10125 [Methylobacterium sp. E-065]|nr:hypothetical protein [Methylobacterium sp. E-065]MCJ2017773.1 hypothetical protein [Methylobacterium sp. E-065]